jgi:hypothetical protein
MSGLLASQFRLCHVLSFQATTVRTQLRAPTAGVDSQNSSVDATDVAKGTSRSGSQ